MNARRSVGWMAVVLLLAAAPLGCKKLWPSHGEATKPDAGAKVATDRRLEAARQVLAQHGVEILGARREGANVVVDYDAARADKYNAQAFVDWCSVFGAFAPIAKGEVRIVNMANGKPLATVSAQAKDVMDYVGDRTDFDQFKSTWKTASVSK
jgi:hypothetical protein